MLTFRPADLGDFAARLLAAAGVPPKDARTLGELLLRADLRGYPGHGIAHIPSYLDRMKAGIIQLAARPQIVREGKSTAVIDGRFYVGQIVALQGMELAIRKARDHGVGIVCLRQSGHIGRLADYVEMAAESGMIGMAAVSVGGGNIAPFGGMQPVAGTNPMAYGVPGPDGEHIVLDFATASMSMGELHRLVARGEPLPSGTLLDGHGNPTTDYQAFVGPPRGVMHAFGGHKGSGLHLVAEVLGGALSGNRLGREWYDRGGPAINGVYLQAVSVDEFQPLEEFVGVIGELREYVTSRQPAPGFSEIRLPGDRSRETTARHLQEGVPLDQEAWERLQEWATELGVSGPPIPVDLH